MPKLKVLTFPDPRLRKVAVPVTKFDKSLEIITSNMLETMYAEDGIGLAATQVDIHERIIVMDLSEDCLLYTSPSPRDAHESRMPSSA